MKSPFPYLSWKGLIRLFSRRPLLLKNNPSPFEDRLIPPAAHVSLQQADAHFFEHFGKLAARSFQTPSVFICTKDAEIVWQASDYVVPLALVKEDLLRLLQQSTGREIGLIRHTGPQGQVKNKLIDIDHAKFAAFAPIRTRQDELLGALCLLDDRERTLNSEEKHQLKSIVAQLVEQLELQKQVDQLLLGRQASLCVHKFFQENTTPATTREAHLSYVARYLAEIAQVELCFIAEVTPQPPTHFRTLAVCFQGTGIENVNYPLEHSPLAHNVGSRIYCYTREVRKLFPSDEYLKSLGAEGFAGISLIDSNGKWLGILAFVNRKPLKNPSVIESILTTAAAPVALELESRNLERALKHAEKESTALFEQSIDGIYYLSLQDRFEKVNPAMAKMLGYAEPEDVLRSVVHVSREVYSNPERHLQVLSQLITQDEIFEAQSQLIQRDGKKIWVSEKIRAIRDPNGKTIRYEGFVENLGPLRQAEEDAASAERHLQTIVDCVEVGVATMGHQGQLVQTNPALERILGYAKRELRLKTFSDLIHPDEVRAYERLCTECLEGKRQHEPLETRVRPKQESRDLTRSSHHLSTPWCHPNLPRLDRHSRGSDSHQANGRESPTHVPKISESLRSSSFRDRAD
jgi:PAS domain S-box-containing protein